MAQRHRNGSGLPSRKVDSDTMLWKAGIDPHERRADRPERAVGWHKSGGWVLGKYAAPTTPPENAVTWSPGLNCSILRDGSGSTSGENPLLVDLKSGGSPRQSQSPTGMGQRGRGKQSKEREARKKKR